MLLPYSKNYFKEQKGITYVEIMIVLAILALIFSAVLLIINPAELRAKARDNKRLSDLSVLERIMSEYVLDNGSYPGTVDTTRFSNVVPTGNTGPVDLVTSGWIDADLVQYNPILPIDPINDATYRYSYRHSDTGFEINAVLEYSDYVVKYSQGDGGNSSTTYEVGNDLTIL